MQNLSVATAIHPGGTPIGGVADLSLNLVEALSLTLLESWKLSAIGACSPRSATPSVRAGLVHVPGAVGPVVASEFRSTFRDLPLCEARSFLRPRNWPATSPFFRELRPIGLGSASREKYLEVFTTDIHGSGNGLTLRTCLDFRTTDQSDGSIVEYRLADDQRPGADPANWGDGQVTVDEGSLTVHSVGDDVEVCAAKRVQFRALRGMPPRIARSLTSMTMALGYGSVVEGFIRRSAQHADSGATRQMPIGRHSAANELSDLQRLMQWSGLLARPYMSMSRLALEELGVVPRRSLPDVQTSTRFETSRDLGSRRALRLCRPLTSGLARAEASSDRVSVEPTVLAQGERAFRVALEVRDLPGGTYWGTVLVEGGSERVIERVPVWVVVP